MSFLVPLAIGILVAVATGAAVARVLAPRPIRSFEESKDFFPEEFSKDGSRLLGRIYRGLGAAEPLAVWDVTTGERLAQYTDLPQWATFAADGQLAFVDGNGNLVLRDPAKLTQQVTLVGELPAKTKLAFSPDGKLVATMEAISNAQGCQIRLWDLNSGKGRVLIADDRANLERRAFQFSSDSRELGALWGDGTVRVWDSVSGEDRGLYRFNTETGIERCWLSPALDRVVLTGFCASIGSSWDGLNWTEDTTLWALPRAGQHPMLDDQAPLLVQRVGFNRYGNEIQFIEPSVPVGLISSVTFTDEGHIIGTRFAAHTGPLGRVTNNFITASDTEEVKVWAIDEGWRNVGAIPACGDGLVSPNGQFVACVASDLRGIELWSLPPPTPPTRLALSVGAGAGLLVASSIWWLSRRRAHHQHV
jgi:WD40 repeat protein